MIQYRLDFKIYDTDGPPETRYSPIYRDKAELDVMTLVSIGDRQALSTLFYILRDKLLAEGSTVLELRALVDDRQVQADLAATAHEPSDRPL